MQWIGVALLAALVFAPSTSYGETARPVPADRVCPVPPDEHWTAQEKFVWVHVCVGDIVDFNSTPGFGGHLNPLTQQFPANRVLRSSFLETILLTDRYRQALTRRGVRIVGARFDGPVDLQNAAIGHDLWLVECLFGSDVIFYGVRSTRSIYLSGSKIAGHLVMRELETDQDVIITGSEITALDLAAAHVGFLTLTDSRISGNLDMEVIRVATSLIMDGRSQFANVDLNGAVIGANVSLDGARITGTLMMVDLQVLENMDMGHDAQFANVVMENAHVGSLNMVGAKFSGTLDMEGINVTGNLSMDGPAQYKDINLSSAQIDGNLGLRDAKIAGKFTMNDAHVFEVLDMSGQAQFSDVNLADAHVRTLDMTGSQVNGKLFMSELRVDESVIMNSVTGISDVDISGANIGGELNMDGSRFSGYLNMSKIKVAFDVDMGGPSQFADIYLYGAHIGTNLFLTGAKVAGQLDFTGLEVGKDAYLSDGAEFSGPVYADFGKYGGLFLSAGIFHKDVDVTGSMITGVLSVGIPGSKGNTQWRGNASLILRNVRADAIQDLPDAWPALLDLAGFTYNNLGVWGSEPTESTPSSGPSTNRLRSRSQRMSERDLMSDRSIDWFENWLSKQKHYSPQPYRQLATVLRVQGFPQAADDILYAGRERERREASSGSQFLWLTILKWIIGYGYRVWLSLVWLSGLLLLGAFVQSTRPVLREKTLRAYLLYSFEMLLPVIRLRGQTREFAASWQDIYFNLHSLLGFILTAFLAAGLTGLAK